MEQLDAEHSKGYAWESEYKRSWDSLQQDEDGRLMLPRKRKSALKSSGMASKLHHRGLIRNVVLVVDASRMTAEPDFKHESGGGNRLEVVLNMIGRSWIQEFFDGNPLSSLSIIGMRDGLAERWADFNTNPSDLTKQMNKTSRIPLGDPSLQNSLEVGRNSLLHMPKHVSREIIILYGSLYSCDPGDIHETIAGLVKDGIRVHIVGIGAQVKIAETIAKATKGVYHVSLDQHHFKECLGKLIQPPSLQTPQCEFIQMGFPVIALLDRPSFCSCHQTQISKGFVCPKCSSIVCQVPRECPICTLTLCSASSLARSYHHIFPPAGFTEITQGNACTGCKEEGEVRCAGCLKDYCFECGDFILEVLFSCPTCAGGAVETLGEGGEKLKTG